MAQSNTVEKKSMVSAYNTYHDLLNSNAMIAFNRVDGLFVFRKKGLVFPKQTCYYNANSNQENNTKYIQDKYTLTIKEELEGYKYVSTRHYSKWQLISLCLYFGTYNPQTEDYIITGKYYKEPKKTNKGEKKNGPQNIK